ncbi:hypothetical protein ACH8E3_14635 [Paenibacillus sp. CMAA1364]
MAMVCFAFGTSNALNNNVVSSKTVDFTFRGAEKDVVSVLSSDLLAPYVQDYYAMRLGHIQPSETEDTASATFSWAGLVDSISKEKESDEKDNLVRYLSSNTPYFIALSSYNTLLQSVNKAPIVLGQDQVALYSDEEFSFAHDILRMILPSNPTVSMGEQKYKLVSKLFTSNLVADRAITLSYALIVPDDMYDTFAGSSSDSSLWNMVLDSDFVEEKGLMQAMYEIDKLLEPSHVNYESYLSSMGRKLFFTVAGSYTTFYLGIMFLIIANTVLGLKFLMQQRSTRNRYSTLAMLGASVESLCSSARIQIWLYFGLVIVVAFVSSIFGIWSMLNSFPSMTISFKNSMVVASVLIAFIAFEWCYIWVIQRKSDQEIRKLIEIE